MASRKGVVEDRRAGAHLPIGLRHRAPEFARRAVVGVIPADVEVRSAGGGRRVLAGYAARFDVLSHDLGGFREKIARGAFTDSIRRGDDAIFVVDHDPGRLLARVKSGTLRLSEDAAGLRFEADMPDTTLGRDVLEMVRRGDLAEMSFKFRAREDSWARDAVGGDIRTLLRVDVGDVSVVVDAAYPETSVSARGVRRFPAPSGGMSVRLAEAIWRAGE